MMSRSDAAQHDVPTPGRWRRLAVFSRGMMRIPHLANLLGADDLAFRPTDADARRIDAVIGWGDRPTAAAATAYAAKHGLPYWRAEDGFLRSVGLGVEGAPPLSLVLDDLGIYYDARRPSRIERILAEDDLDDATELARARAAIARFVASGVSKYNEAPPVAVSLGSTHRQRVLVVDQTRGDQSVDGGLGSAAAFAAMLAAARAENPSAELIVKTHPDVLAGKRRGYLEDVAGPDVRLWAQPGSGIELARQVARVYVVTSQLGLEALIAGAPVTCFGAPFYAGWGLTDDRAAVARRGRPRTLEQLFVAAYLRYARYIDPDTGAPCPLERVLDHVELQRRAFAANQAPVFGVGFLPWKRADARRYLRCPGNRVVFVRSAAQARRLGFDRGSRLLVLGHREGADIRRLAADVGVPIWRMEDGFLRSVGLGSNVNRPASLVVDRQGIYYDPTAPSELETLLETGAFSADELTRAAELRRRILAGGLSKYNVGRDRPVTTRSAGRRVLLVPGQVEDDASIRKGTRDICTNQALLETVRRGNPDAYILWKPHPDVVSGNRRGNIPDSIARAACDQIEIDATLAACLDAADEVHTMTSLVGFEAILRGKRVHCYGLPFYAGWGLTTDRHPIPRRSRRLTVEELVAGALIRYPRYVHPRGGHFTTPEAIINELIRQRSVDPTAGAIRVSWLRRQLRRASNLYRELVHAT